MLFKHALPNALYSQTRLLQLPKIAVKACNYDVLEKPCLFHERLLELIKTAKERILITALYLQDDDSGREVIQALYAAQKKNPKLHIRVYVDFHRAQRGLIGKDHPVCNCDLYYKMSEGVNHPPAIYGIPVKRREIFGVLHTKGMVFDDTVLYSGASINDVYLDAKGKYRLDRYHEIKSKDLANSFCDYATAAFHINFAVQDFSQGKVKCAKEIRDEIKQLRRHLTVTQYQVKDQKIKSDEIGITPLSGLGKRNNTLNKAILWLLTCAKKEAFICTPYFNPPKIVLKAIESALDKGVKITLVIGDKTANDFFIHEGEPFSIVGAVPYIYEQNIREFVMKHEAKIANGQLKIKLWKDGINTYHLKGIFIDRNYAVVTGNNLNPRAWALDLENGMIIYDPNHLMQEKFSHEKQHILKHTTDIKKLSDFECDDNYPEQVQKVLKRVRRLRASLILKQLL